MLGISQLGNTFRNVNSEDSAPVFHYDHFLEDVFTWLFWLFSLDNIIYFDHLNISAGGMGSINCSRVLTIKLKSLTLAVHTFFNTSNFSSVVLVINGE